MSKRDYYDVLGLSKSASKDEIRKAYRGLSKKYHPDLNKAADAEEKFKEATEAYEVLSDDSKKQIMINSAIRILTKGLVVSAVVVEMASDLKTYSVHFSVAIHDVVIRMRREKAMICSTL